MQDKFCLNFDSYYFIGIGGVSMSALAEYLFLTRKKSVAGYDRTAGEYAVGLSAIGIEVDTGEKRRDIRFFDAVVCTDAIPENDFTLRMAKLLKKPIIPRGELLRAVSKEFKNVIAVAGCHGKTTCTSMVAHIFASANKAFCAHIGGKDRVFSNYYYCGNEYFLTEACEYKKNFLLLEPDLSIILSSDPDHLECYGSVENLKKAYAEFSEKSKFCATLYGDEIVGNLSFGLDKNADYHAENISDDGGEYSFDVYFRKQKLGRVNLSVYGKHNIYNALAAIAVSQKAGIDFETAAVGISSFTGVERRFEKIGKINGACAIADYAHHPREISATVSAAEEITGGKLYIIFQPHTYSRTKNLFSEFVKTLSRYENLLIYRTFAAREYFDDAGSALTLSQNIPTSRYGDSVNDILKFVSNAGKGDIILFLGAGDIYEIAKTITKKN